MGRLFGGLRLTGFYKAHWGSIGEFLTGTARVWWRDQYED